jgi:hypothetical protein
MGKVVLAVNNDANHGERAVDGERTDMLSQPLDMDLLVTVVTTLPRGA